MKEEQFSLEKALSRSYCTVPFQITMIKPNIDKFFCQKKYKEKLFLVSIPFVMNRKRSRVTKIEFATHSFLAKKVD